MHIESANVTDNIYQADNLVENKIAEICDFKNDTCPLAQALRYHFECGGSRTRSNLSYKFSKNFLINEKNAVLLACIPELLHNASLIHDDLQDLDEERRENLSVWKKFGPDIAICAGDYLISCAYKCISELETKNIKLILQKVHSHIHTTIKGQIGDLTQDKNQTLVDVDLYLDISRQKSGALLAMPLTLALLYTERLNCIHAAEEAFNNYALAYQIYDDIHDIKQDQSKKGIKSGLNIVTIMQRNGEATPIKAAAELALEKLYIALDFAAKLPLPSNTILEKEILQMQKKIKVLSTQ
ncbi:MAG: polyprenyl synthetase family protein [Alphaproteobacteria bacterium]|nr:polyprenyl synthetase family protein [Alphaproteobacteria bacterium]NCQ88926.1 polyprenyl synthetase family protein [Alphaproteobacteria bacterium]NCT07828.1 polyprenyl synthetase family protein [Alphaproteobacteria bacterium]